LVSSQHMHISATSFHFYHEVGNTKMKFLWNAKSFFQNKQMLHTALNTLQSEYAHIQQR